MADRVVLDASAGVEILNRSFAGVQLAKMLEPPGVQVWTVEHFHLEVAKVFRRDVISGDIADAEATELVVSLAAWPLYVARVAPLLVGAWELRHNLILHDALYVVLARQLDATLLTGDKKLARAPGLNVRIRTVA
jgi:predicted nucleic acid-binding protein